MRITPTMKFSSPSSEIRFWISALIIALNSIGVGALWLVSSNAAFLFGAAILLLLLQSVCGLIIYRRIIAALHKGLTIPLERIISMTNEIADGAVSRRLDEDRSAAQEVVRVAHAINRLARRASRDINEMRRLERVRSEFVANVSHELRTPIFSVQGYLETLLDGAIDDPEVSKRFLEKAYNNALRLNALLGDLIDISRIESGELKFSFRFFSMNELLKEVVHSMEMRAKQANVTVHCEMLDTDSAYGDKERLTQVLTNLLENAIKYNVDGGDVFIRCERVDSAVKVSVRDTGIGIPDEHVARIFERFYRVDKDRSRSAGGTGLGLAIVKHILEAHGAQILVQSKEGEGTEIAFILRSGQ